MDSIQKSPERQFGRLIEERAAARGRILGISHSTLRLFAHDRDGRLSLRVLLPLDLELKSVGSTVGIEVDSEHRESGDPELAFISRNPAMDSMFLAFVRYAVDRTIGAETESEAIEQLLDAYESFKEFMENEKSLSAEGVKGLYAELVVLSRLIEQGLDPLTAILGWKGPFGENKDFVFPNGQALEVKSAPLNANTVRISSVDQLDPNGLMLRLCVVHLERSHEGVEGAKQLGTLIDEVGDSLRSYGLDSEIFRIALERYGLASEDKDNRSMWFVAQHPVQYEVLESFPRVDGSLLPDGVSRVSYDVSIDSLAPFAVDVQD